MTTKSELTKLLDFDSKAPRIVGFAGSVALATKDGDPLTAAAFNLLDPDTKRGTDKWLFVALSQGDAMGLAASILGYAAKHNWPPLEIGQMVETEMGDLFTKSNL
jgi:hypothetical protein